MRETVTGPARPCRDSRCPFGGGDQPLPTRILELAEIEQQNGLGLVHWLVNKGKEFERLVAHPRVVPYFEYMLGSDYILSPLTSNTICPGAKDGGYHINYSLGQIPELLPVFPIFANTFWLLDDFTPQNGGTRFVPASHLRLKKPPVGLKANPEEVCLKASEGSVFCLTVPTGSTVSRLA